MAEQKITVPTVGGTSGFTADQRYFYDGLNRLTKAKRRSRARKPGNKPLLTTDMATDGYAANTTAPANCTSAICNPTISTATVSRLNPPGRQLQLLSRIREFQPVCMNFRAIPVRSSRIPT
ncbi:MAG: hypothetical protein IPN69_12760 [Acidobacteria bacterium]|nr:hypothetical protein [Acidobacteriota bacterium]